MRKASLIGSSHAAVVLALLIAAARVVSAQAVAYTGSAQAATGDYLFTERTGSLYVSNGFVLTTGRLRVSLSVPVVVQSTPWVTYTAAGPAAGGLPTGGSESGQVGTSRGHGHGSTGTPIALPDTSLGTSAGLGDPSLLASVEVIRERGLRPSIRLIGSVKVPLTDPDSGFGTGAWDAGAGFGIAKSLSNWLVFVDLTAWTFGDLPDLELQDALAYSVALGHALGGGRYGVLASVSGFTEVIDGVEPPVQAGLGLSARVTGRVSLTANVSVGLTESAPDLTGGLGWRIAL